MRILFSCLILVLVVSCVSHDVSPDPFDCATSDLGITLRNTSPATACGTPDGAIEVEATGGVPPYHFTIDATTNELGTFSALLPGVYSAKVTDQNGCAATISNITVSSSGFSFEAIVQEDTDCHFGNGSVVVNVLDGLGPYEFQLADGPVTSNNTFVNLKHGTYDILLKDANHCTALLNVTIPSGPTSTSFSNDIKPIIVSSCADSGCHNGISRPDLRLYEKAKLYANQMKSLTRDGSMPFEGSITQEQIDLISCWVDEGALNN